MRGWVIAVVVAALAGCSNGNSQGERAGPEPASKPATAAVHATACQVIDKATVDAVMGRDTGAQQQTGAEMCQYIFQGDRLMDQGLVSLMIRDRSLAAHEQGLREMKSAMEPLPGIGDRALWTDYGLYVEHNGRTGIYIAGQGTTDEAANRAETIALAKATADKI